MNSISAESPEVLALQVKRPYFDEYLPVKKAAQRLGMSVAALKQKIKNEELRTDKEYIDDEEVLTVLVPKSEEEQQIEQDKLDSQIRQARENAFIYLSYLTHAIGLTRHGWKIQLGFSRSIGVSRDDLVVFECFPGAQHALITIHNDFYYMPEHVQQEDLVKNLLQCLFAPVKFSAETFSIGNAAYITTEAVDKSIKVLTSGLCYTLHSPFQLLARHREKSKRNTREPISYLT